VRTDGDSWDIVSSVGKTALGVAAFRALETTCADPLIRDEYASLFVHAAGDSNFITLVGDPSLLGESAVFPGLMGFRTKFFDDFFLAAALEGIRQMVIVAAGLDARAYRLDLPSDTVVFEIDQPKVLEFKDFVLTEHDAKSQADRRIVEADLREDWPAALEAAGFDRTAPTAWSAEGLLPYLPAQAQDDLFERIHDLSAPGSRLAVETFAPSADPEEIRSIEQKFFVRNPFGDLDVVQLFYLGDRSDPVEWLTTREWRVDSTDPIELASNYGRPYPVSQELRDAFQQSQYLSATK
jgi:methyltransferase (TIGR00027 family)